MTSALIKHVSDASFEADVLQADTPVLVDYWAPWCGPCKMIAPLLDDAADRYQGRLQIVKMDVDDNRQTPAKFGIRGVPTLMLFKDGQPAATQVGALGRAQLTTFLDQHLPAECARCAPAPQRWPARLPWPPRPRPKPLRRRRAIPTGRSPLSCPFRPAAAPTSSRGCWPPGLPGRPIGPWWPTTRPARAAP